MKWRCYLAFAGIACLVVGLVVNGRANPKPEAVIIPLNRIWALEMPGTLNIAELEPDKNPRSAHGPLLREIRRSLAPLREGEEAKPGFSVLGTGADALREAHAVIVDGQTPRDLFGKGDDISLVFFSHSIGSYVHLEQVARRDNEIEVRYRFVPHETREATEHIALIPIKKITMGTLKVK